MVLKSDRIRLKKMLSDSITVLCRAGLPFQSKFQVEALIGITLDDSEVVLLSFKETSSSNGLTLSSELADDRDAEDDADNKCSSPTDAEQIFNPAPATIKDEYEDVDWNAAGSYRRPNRGRRRACPLKLEDFEDSGESTRVNASSSTNPNEQFVSTSAENDGQSSGLDYNQFDGNLANSSGLDRNYSRDTQKAYRAQMKVEASDDNADDCMIVKSEEPSLAECYEVDDNQSWDGQVDLFDGNNFHALQSVGAAGDMIPTVYPQDPNWLPQLSKPAGKKFKLPLQHRRQTWLARPSATHTKSRNFQPTGRPHSKAARPVSEEVTSNWRDENCAADWQNLICTVCGLQLNTAQSLREHVNGVHLNLNSYSCEYCHQTFKWRMALSRHRRNFHKLFVKRKVKFEN